MNGPAELSSDAYAVYLTLIKYRDHLSIEAKYLLTQAYLEPKDFF